MVFELVLEIGPNAKTSVGVSHLVIARNSF